MEISRRGRVTNDSIREIMKVVHARTIVEDIKTIQLTERHVQRMPENILPKLLLNWAPVGTEKAKKKLDKRHR